MPATIAAIADALGPLARRFDIDVLDRCDSTNAVLLARAEAGAPSGTVVIAKEQTAGRGRRGRSWFASPSDSLTFSLLWRFERGAGHLAGLSLAAGVAVARALSACGVAGVRVKWPNDVVVDFRKLAGILVETSGDLQGPSVAVIGIGVNYRLGDAALGRIDQPVSDVARAAPVTPSRNVVLGRALAELVAVLDAFEREGFASVRPEWRALHAYQGRRVRVIPSQGAAYDAQVLDVAEDGTLVVSAAGLARHLASAEISLR